MTDQLQLSEQVVIRHQQGLHARPAAQLAKMAAGFDASLTLTRESDGSEADCRSVLSLLMLAAGAGAKLTLKGEGAEAEAALRAIADFFASGFEMPSK